MNTPQGFAPYAGLRVIDLGHYIAGPLAAMLLGDQGADVVHIDRPDGCGSMGSLDAVLQRNKSRITIDLKTNDGRRQALKLIANADVLIENFRPGVMDRLGLGHVSCRSRNPRLIYLSIPGFASSDTENAELAAWEGVVGAATGMFTNISFSRDFLGLPPVYTSLPLPSVYGAVHGATAVAMALIVRERDGCGEHIEVPLASAFLSAMGANLMAYAEYPERYGSPPVSRAFKELQLPSLRESFARMGKAGEREALEFASKLTPPMMCTFECGDGRLLYVFAMDHKRMSLRLLKELDLHEQFRESLVERDPYLSTSVQNNISDVGTLSKALKDQLRVAMSDAFKQAAAHAWEERLTKMGIPCAVHRSTAEWLKEPHLMTSGIAVNVSDPILGTMTQPGPAVWLEDNPLVFLTPRARATTSGSLPAWANSGAASRSSGKPMASTAGCLAGVRVLDLSTMVAGPSCGRTLAEYGAEVIKIDSVAPYLGPRMTIWYAAELNQGKRSVLLDLKVPDGREAFLRLVENADVVLHNMRPGVMESLGLGIEVLRKRKPDIVECALSAFDGPRSGPWSTRPGYDPVLQAASGIMTRYGSAEAPELHAIASTVDYLTGFLAAFGTAASLFKRTVHPGRGTSVKASLAQSAMLVQLPFTYSYAGRTWDEPSGQEANGPSARSRLYKALDGWLYVHFEPENLAALDRRPSFTGVATAEDTATFLADRIVTMPLSEITVELRHAGAGVHVVTDLATIRTRYQVARTAVEGESARLIGSFAILEDTKHPSGTTVHTVAPFYARLRRNPLRVGPSNEKHGHSTVSVLKAAGLEQQAIFSLQKHKAITNELSLPYLPS
jgi:crotonobetainyl-CoA:carnitine CoA-transferase CaiB-like acyl-CoA transferase